MALENKELMARALEEYSKGTSLSNFIKKYGDGPTKYQTRPDHKYLKQEFSDMAEEAYLETKR
jgi:hypothetical protein